MKPLALVFCGIPGAGKTTVRDRILRSVKPISFDLCAPDDMIEIISKATSSFYRDVYMDSASKEVCYDAAWHRFYRAIRHQNNLVVDRTHLSPPYRKKVLENLQGVYRAIAITVDTPHSVPEWVARLDGRRGKDIPPGTLFSMTRAFQAPHCDEGFERCFQGQSGDNLVDNVASYIRETQL